MRDAKKSLKRNLHTGFVVKTRNGAVFAVVRTGGYKPWLTSPSLSIPFSAYLPNLMAREGALDPGFDVMEIYGLLRNDRSPYEALTHSLNTENRPMLWKRGGTETINT